MRVWAVLANICLLGSIVSSCSEAQKKREQSEASHKIEVDNNEEIVLVDTLNSQGKNILRVYKEVQGSNKNVNKGIKYSIVLSDFNGKTLYKNKVSNNSPLCNIAFHKNGYKPYFEGGIIIPFIHSCDGEEPDEMTLYYVTSNYKAIEISGLLPKLFNTSNQQEDYVSNYTPEIVASIDEEHKQSLKKIWKQIATGFLSEHQIIKPANTQSKALTAFIPKNYEVVVREKLDINNDNLDDVLMVVRNTKESQEYDETQEAVKRTLLILEAGQENNYSLILSNENIINEYDGNCPVTGSEKIIVNNNSFTVEQKTCEDFMFVKERITFEYSNNNIILKKIEKKYIDRNDPSREIPSKVLLEKDFGRVEIGKFNRYELNSN